MTLPPDFPLLSILAAALIFGVIVRGRRWMP